MQITNPDSAPAATGAVIETIAGTTIPAAAYFIAFLRDRPELTGVTGVISRLQSPSRSSAIATDIAVTVRPVVTVARVARSATE